MNQEKNMRLSQVARKLNVGTDTISSFLEKKGFIVDNKPNSKITVEQFDLLSAEFVSAGMDKQEAAHVTIGKTYASLSAPVSGHDPIKVVSPASIKEKIRPKKQVQTQTQPGLIEQVLTEEQQTQQNKNTVKKKIPLPPHYETSVPVLPGLKTVGKVSLTPKKVKPKVEPLVVAPIMATPISTEEPAIPSILQDKLPTSVKEEDPAPELPSNTLEPTVRETQEMLKKNNKIAFDDSTGFKGPTVVGKMILPERTSRKNQYTSIASIQVRANASTSSRTGNVSGTSLQQGIAKKNMAKAAHPNHLGGSIKKTGPFKPTTLSTRKEKDNKLKIIEKDKEGVSSQEIESQIKKTLAKLNQGTGDSARSKYKRGRRSANLEAEDKRQREEKEEEKVLRVTEFISANELATFMGVTVNEVLSTCMSLGMIISINQRLDAETITVVADEFGYDVAFVDVHDEEVIEEVEDIVGELMERPPIVTIMGHVDHGKTSLLDYIRTTKVTAKEVGGITQHIGAYDIITDNGKKIVFLDTPGHEAFTAMRTRGAKVTDIIVIVVAADDSVMTQTKEAISHAQVAGCPIIIAINKIDKPQANPERVKEDLANQNILVEDWGGKYQCQELSAKTGQGINELLEKILLEASLLELKATPARQAKGTIIESFLDPGRGYVSTAMVQDGTLRVGDIVLAGVYYGKVKAMLNHQGVARKTAPPATPVQILGLNGAPRAGDTFRVMKGIKEVAELAQKKHQLLREQTLRTKSHLTLDEIGRRLAVGNFQQLNLIIKGDVDGSIEALADSLLKLSHEEVQVNILHKCVGAVSESDVLLASAADAIIISFHIKLSAQTKKLAEKERVEIKQYSIIYDAIDDVRSAVQGLLAPVIEEIPTGRAEVKKIFTISKIGNIAGCQVQTGFIKHSNPVRVIRKGEIVFTGAIHTLKHGLEEIKQVKSVSECGIHIQNFDEIEVGDMIEGFERKETQRKL